MSRTFREEELTVKTRPVVVYGTPSDHVGSGNFIAQCSGYEASEYAIERIRVADLLEHTVVPSAANSLGKIVEPSNISVNIGDMGTSVDNPGGGSVNVSSVEDNMTNVDERPSADGLSEDVTPSVRDTTVEDIEGMESIGVLSDAGIDGLSTEGGDEDVALSVVDTVLMLLENKKSKNKSGADVGEPSELKKKLSKEERAAKRAKRTYPKTPKAAETETTDVDVQEVVEDQTLEVQVHVTVRPTVSNSWNSTDEQQGNEAVQDSNDENVPAVISRRRKAKGKLKINKNRSRVGNKRIPKNIITVSTENVALNSEEKEAKWKFMARRRIATERMLSQVIK
ncbi:hypothetical protein LIER_23109 [Lithospermum erythrorhizon]|uniref:Uncharacterized protein n=1 Tax=Lithospermum erythrorhizon TaxID=34254 RepID=A0AAV3QW81_LITER